MDGKVWRERALAGAKNGARAARVAVKAVIGPSAKERADAEEKARQAKLIEQRREVLAKPGFHTLEVNLDFQKGRRDPDHRSKILDIHDSLALIAQGKPVNPYASDAIWLERTIDPSLTEAEIHQKAVEYCHGTATRFVENARDVALVFSSQDDAPTTGQMSDAITILMGYSRLNNNEHTIFTDQTWSGSDYTPDYIDLGVDLGETGVSQDHVMAGVGLCIGLWVRLADNEAARPVSGHKFGPVYKHCSFLSLVTDTGWADHMGQYETFKTKQLDGFLGRNTEPDVFLAQFRSQEFFANTFANLQK